MSNEFVNNYPANPSVFPSMLDHIDAIRHAYFLGLHAEILNIENAIGGVIHGDYPSLKARLDGIDITPCKAPALILTPHNVALPGAGAPSIQTIQSGNSAYKVLRFANSTEDDCCWTKPIPFRVGSGNIKVTIYLTTPATSGTAWVRVWIYSSNNNEVWAYPFTTGITYVDIYPVAKTDANDLIIMSGNTNFVWTEGRLAMVQIARLGDLENDTLENYINLIAVKIEEV
jgi:hypothetical protein